MAHPVVDKTQEIADFISTQLASIVLNNMWIEQHTYIVATPTKNCHADRRGPQETKFCREGDANYLILDEPGITAVPWQSVRLPKGYDRLGALGSVIVGIVIVIFIIVIVVLKRQCPRRHVVD